MASLNQMTVIGNLTKDPEIKSFEGGGMLANLSIATNYSYKNKSGEKVEEVEFFDIVLNGHSAKFAEDYAKKGMNVFAQGRVKTDTYEKDGVTQYRKKVRADQFSILGNKGSNENATGSSTGETSTTASSVDTAFEAI